MDYIPREIEAEFRATCDSNVTAGRATGPAVRSVAALLSTCSPLPSPLNRLHAALLSKRAFIATGSLQATHAPPVHAACDRPHTLCRCLPLCAD